VFFQDKADFTNLWNDHFLALYRLSLSCSNTVSLLRRLSFTCWIIILAALYLFPGAALNMGASHHPLAFGSHTCSIPDLEALLRLVRDIADRVASVYRYVVLFTMATSDNVRRTRDDELGLHFDQVGPVNKAILLFHAVTLLKDFCEESRNIGWMLADNLRFYFSNQPKILEQPSICHPPIHAVLQTDSHLGLLLPLEKDEHPQRDP